MNTLNGNFIEHTIPNLNDATLDLLIGGVPLTMNTADFKAAMAPEPTYKVFTALLTQSGESAPTIYVLEDTIGIINITRNSIGDFYINSSNSFGDNSLKVSKINYFSIFYDCFFESTYQTSSIVRMTCRDKTNTLKDFSSMFDTCFIELRVYN